MKMFLAFIVGLMLAATTSAKAETLPFITTEVDGESYESPTLPSGMREIRHALAITGAYDKAQAVWTACLAVQRQQEEAQQSFDTAQAAAMATEIGDVDFTEMNEAFVAMRAAQAERDSVCQQVVEPTERFEALVADWNEVQEERHQATVELQNQVETTAELAADNDTKIGMILVDLRRLETELSELRRIDAATSAWCGIPGNSHTRLCRARSEGH